MRRQSIVLVLLAVLCIGVGIYWYERGDALLVQPPSDTTSVSTIISTVPLSVADGAIVEGFGQFHDSPIINGRKTFSSDRYGVSFTYPSNYFTFTATSTNSDKSETYGIGLLQDSSPLREAIAGTHNEPGMIPRISILMYLQKGSDVSLEELARQRIVYANGDSAPIPIFSKLTVSGIPAIRYTDASGLYSRDTVLFRHSDWMVQIAADDATYFKTDLDSILASIQLK